MKSVVILFSIAAIAAGCRGNTKKIGLAETQLRGLATAIDAYEVDNDHFPTNLTVLGGRPPFGMPYTKAQDSLVDPWGTPYSYSVHSNRYDLRSAGPDLRLQTADDVMLRKETPNQQPEGIHR